MIHEIKSWYDGKVLYSAEGDSLKAVVEMAVKHGANLDYANLDYANLDYANLDYANLDHANLDYANLVGANLDHANLDYANLVGAKLPTGELWEEYLSVVLPALLTSGGKSIETFGGHWGCHNWDNCPMAHAFGVTGEDQTPLLLRPRVRQFVQLFDAKLILWPLPAGEQK